MSIKNLTSITRRLVISSSATVLLALGTVTLEAQAASDIAYTSAGTPMILAGNDRQDRRDDAKDNQDDRQDDRDDRKDDAKDNQDDRQDDRDDRRDDAKDNQDDRRDNRQDRRDDR